MPPAASVPPWRAPWRRADLLFMSRRAAPTGSRPWLGFLLDIMTVWRKRADDVRGRALDCGHFIPEEMPAELIRELLDFLPAS